MKRFLITFIIFHIFILSNIVESHDNKVIHPFTITGKAMELLSPLKNPTEEQKKYVELQQYFHDAIPSGYRVKSGDDYNYFYDKVTKVGTLGAIAEDREAAGIRLDKWGDEVDVLAMRAHFYCPYNKTNNYEPWWGFGDWVPIWGELINNTRDYGRSLWNDGLFAYKVSTESNQYNQEIAPLMREKSFWYLGRVLHLLEDMSSAPHVHNDWHAFGDNFEIWCYDIVNKEMENKSPAFLTAMQGTKIADVKSYDNAMQELATITYDRVKISGKLNRSDTNPVEGDLAKMFRPAEDETWKQFAGVTYMNFVPSQWYDVIDLDGYWEIAGVGVNVGYYDNNTITQSKLNTTFWTNDWWRIPEYKDEDKVSRLTLF